MADHVERAFQEHYIRTSDYPSEWDEFLMRDPESNHVWERDGEPVEEAIESAASIPAQAAHDVLGILRTRHADIENDQMHVESEFGPGTHYEQKYSAALLWQIAWQNFETALKTEARYFSRFASEHLAAIFGGIDQLNTNDHRQLVAEGGPGTDIETLFRARVFQSRPALEAAISRPDLEVGPPPSRYAAAGRMNARGISVFYGATARAVALAEVRPPVGSDVVVAEFRITRQLRLLNLPALQAAVDHGSVFDPTLLARLERVEFLRTLGSKMTRPVMPDDQDFDYLATQAVADFLATENTPALDGIIFESTQSGGGSNVVLFHKASRVKELELPKGTSLRASTSDEDEDGPYVEYRVVELIPPEGEIQAETAEDDDWSMDDFSQPPRHRDPRPLTLQVNEESVQVHHVKRVAVECEAYPVDRTRRVKVENHRF
ncbi:RES family NAD+ phosphorylase [Pseudomonas aeruginosa]|uniref:RES family NAD+ phosphorylase n=2 Tax=Pseudomonas aeruginosa TaxID=287 RepID=UPI00396714E7